MIDDRFLKWLAGVQITKNTQTSKSSEGKDNENKDNTNFRKKIVSVQLKPVK